MKHDKKQDVNVCECMRSQGTQLRLTSENFCSGSMLPRRKTQFVKKTQCLQSTLALKQHSQALPNPKHHLQRSNIDDWNLIFQGTYAAIWCTFDFPYLSGTCLMFHAKGHSGLRRWLSYAHCPKQKL